MGKTAGRNKPAGITGSRNARQGLKTSVNKVYWVDLVNNVTEVKTK